jgi:hypothetical protein
VSRAIGLCSVSIGLVFVALIAYGAQPGTVPRIGYLGTHTAWTGHFRDALAELDYAEGRNVEVEWRVVDGRGAASRRPAHNFAARRAEYLEDPTPQAFGRARVGCVFIAAASSALIVRLVSSRPEPS